MRSERGVSGKPQVWSLGVLKEVGGQIWTFHTGFLGNMALQVQQEQSRILSSALNKALYGWVGKLNIHLAFLLPTSFPVVPGAAWPLLPFCSLPI